MTDPSLEQTQRLLWTLVTAPEGVASGLAQLHAADRAVADALVIGDQRLPAIERLDVYAEMYFYRILDCLKGDFAALLAVVGDLAFHNLITSYLVEHPPSHFSLRYAGQHLPAFLQQHPFVERWPYAPDLAALEWAILEAFDAPDAPPIAPAVLAAVPQDDWPALRLQLTPSLQLLQLQWPAHVVWERVQRDEAPGEPAHAPTPMRVWRQDLRVFHRPIGGAEAVALTAAVQGASFADVCAQLAGDDGEAAGAERAFSLLSEWLNDGLLTGIAVA